MDRVIDAFIQLHIRYRKSDALNLSVEDFSSVLGLSKSKTIECLKVMVSRQYLLKRYWRAGCKGRPRNVYWWGIAGDNVFNNWLSCTTQLSLGDYIRELYVIDVRMSFQARSLFAELLKLAHGAGYVSGVSLDKLSENTGLSKSSVRYALKKLTVEGYVLIEKGQASPSFFKSPVNLYVLDLTHSSFVNVSRAYVKYRYEPAPFCDAHEYFEAVAIHLISMRIKKALSKRKSRELKNRPFSNVDYRREVDIQIGALKQITPLITGDFEPLALLFENPKLVPYLQVKLQFYASYLLTFHWDALEADEEISELVSLIGAEVSLKRFNHLLNDDQLGQVFDDLLTFLYQVAIGIARKIKKVLDEAGQPAGGSKYVIIPPKSYRKIDGVSFSVLSLSDTRRGSCSNVVITEKQPDEYTVVSI